MGYRPAFETISVWKASLKLHRYINLPGDRFLSSIWLPFIFIALFSLYARKSRTNKIILITFVTESHSILYEVWL